jgi:hypothetical protein
MRVVVPREASLEMRLVTAWMGQVDDVRLLLSSQAMALSTWDCSVCDQGRRERVEGGDSVRDRNILRAFDVVGGRVFVVVVVGVCVGFVGGRRD